MENSTKLVSKVFAAVLIGLLVQSYSTAASVNNILTIDFDGTVSGTVYTEGSLSGEVLIDEDGNAPDFITTPGMMYTDGRSAGPYTFPNGWTVAGTTNMPRAFGKDEGLKVNVGTGFTLGESFIIEAWAKPDYASLPTSGNGRAVLGIANYFATGPNPSADGDNNFGQVALWKWSYNEGWSDENQQVYGSGLMQLYSDGYQQASSFGGITIRYNQNGVDPNAVLSPTEFSHIAVVYNYDDQTGFATVSYYVNAELKLSGSGLIEDPSIPMPANIGIGNFPFSNFVSADEIYGVINESISADINYNTGWSGWFDSFALSTFTGDFDGPHNFVLLDPQFCGDLGTEYKPADFNKDCKVNLFDFAEYATLWLED